MKSRMFTLAIAAAATLVALVLASVGGATNQATVKVADVTDVGGLNDKGFNHLSYVGLVKAEKQLGIQGRVYISNTAADRKPNLQAAAQAGYGLVVGVGVNFQFGPLDAVAPAFPNTKFLGIDVDWSALSSKAPNIRGVQFREQEAGYLVDPHTAVAIAAAEKESRDPALPMVVLATAHPAKFPDAVEAACGVRPALPDWLSDLPTRPERVTTLAADQAAVERFILGASRAAREGAAA